jgi:hypothetical protein
MAWMQRGIGVLKHHLNIAAQRAGDLPSRLQRFAENLDRAVPLRIQAGNGPQHRRLAATGRSDQAESLALLDHEADVANGGKSLALSVE